VSEEHAVTLVGASVSEEGVAGVLVAVCGSHAAARVSLLEDRYATSLASLERLRDTCNRQARASHLYVADRCVRSSSRPLQRFKSCE
jgi:hypothetical protein